MLEKTVNEMLAKTFPDEKVTATVDERRIVHLAGECSTYQTLIDVGHAVAALPFSGKIYGGLCL